MNCWRWVWTVVPMIQPDNDVLVIQTNITLSWDASYTAFFIPVCLCSHTARMHDRANNTSCSVAASEIVSLRCHLCVICR